MHVDIDHYAGLASPIHRWDPRARIASLLALAFCIASTRSLRSAALGFAAAAALTLIGRFPLLAIWRRGRWALLILAPVALLLPVIGPAERTTAEHAAAGAAILLRGSAIVTLTLPLFGASRIADTMAGLRALGFPAPLATMFLFAYRYVFVFLEDLRRMRLSMAVRGYQPRIGVRPLELAAAQVATLVVASFERTERIHHAMRVRGFRSEFPARRRFRLLPADLGKGAVVLAVTLMIAVLEWLP